MKISIGTRIKDGPWGGGNLFAINLRDFLEKAGHEVVYDLEDDDIDIILITEPRRTSESSAFTSTEVKNYLRYVKFDTLVVHRINECDERKNTNFVNKYLIYANKIADTTVFVSTWLKDLYISHGLPSKNLYVILSGSDKKIFNSKNYIPWNRKEKIKIVTHHWGDNWNKGFDIYRRLDNLLYDNEWKDKLEFNYIGNIPKNFKFQNMNHINPKSGNDLSAELKKNHLYITASLNEPSGNHHIEAAQCGLPVLYIESGGIPEYCHEYGLSFNNDNFERMLNQIIEDYDIYFNKTKSYKFNSDIMCSEYLKLFEQMINTRNMLIEKREFFQNKNRFLDIIFRIRRIIKKY